MLALKEEAELMSSDSQVAVTQGPDVSFWPPWAPVYIRHIHTLTGIYIHMHRDKNK